jgi:hypothetical protein
MGNPTLPTISDKIISWPIHNGKLIASLLRELKEKDLEIRELRQSVSAL